MIPTVVVIPSRYEPQRLRVLLKVVEPDADLCLVLDNGHELPLKGAVDTRGLGIYAQWNLGWRMALERYNPVNVAILNDDIRILPGTITMLAAALRMREDIGCVYPDTRARATRLPSRIQLMAEWDPAVGRSLTGFCFMFKGELQLPPFDEGMEWYYSDSQFDEELKKAGYGVARVNGVPISHRSDAETNDWARRPELKEATVRDGIRWAKLHHHIKNGVWVPESE